MPRPRCGAQPGAGWVGSARRPAADCPGSPGQGGRPGPGRPVRHGRVRPARSRRDRGPEPTRFARTVGRAPGRSPSRDTIQWCHHSRHPEGHRGRFGGQRMRPGQLLGQHRHRGPAGHRMNPGVAHTPRARLELSERRVVLERVTAFGTHVGLGKLDRGRRPALGGWVGGHLGRHCVRCGFPNKDSRAALRYRTLRPDDVDREYDRGVSSLRSTATPPAQPPSTSTTARYMRRSPRSSRG